MRSRLAVLALLLAPLSACALPQPGPAYGPSQEYEDSDYGDVPMRARLYSDASGLRVNVNRSAYVAIFEIVPGRGAALVYPQYESERSYLNAGYNRVWFNGPRNNSLYFSAQSSGYDTRQPHQYLLIASRQPLRIRAIQERPGELRRQLGYQAVNSMSSRALMNDIADLVLPSVADEDWDSDVLTIWPETYTRLAYDGDTRMTVRCMDGRVVYTSLYWADNACYDYDRRYGHNRPGNQPPPPPRDTTGSQGTPGVQVPGRHRPEPPRGDTTSGAGVGRIADRPGEGGGARPRTFGEEPRVRPGGDDGDAEPAFRPREQPRLEPRHVPADGDVRLRPRAAEPQGGGDEPARVAPRAEPRATPRADPRSEPQVEVPRYEPRREAPREEPRYEPRRETPREEPRYEPRREAPREQPRQEAPRAEPRPEPRAEPRSEPRSEPRRESPPPQVREAPRSEPPARSEPSQPSVSRPSAPAEPPR